MAVLFRLTFCPSAFGNRNVITPAELFPGTLHFEQSCATCHQQHLDGTFLRYPTPGTLILPWTLDSEPVSSGLISFLRY